MKNNPLDLSKFEETVFSRFAEKVMAVETSFREANGLIIELNKTKKLDPQKKSRRERRKEFRKSKI